MPRRKGQVYLPDGCSKHSGKCSTCPFPDCTLGQQYAVLSTKQERNLRRNLNIKKSEKRRKTEVDNR